MASTPCVFDGCSKIARGRGYCPGHYRQLRLGQRLRPLAQYGKNAGRTCAGPECDKRASSSGLCSAHKSQQARGQELVPIGQRRPGPDPMYVGASCVFEGCGRKPLSRGMCASHKQQFARLGELRPLGWRPPKPPKMCSADGCNREAAKHGLCETHYAQERRYGRLQPIRQSNGRVNGRVIHRDGYVRIKQSGHSETDSKGWGLEHRIVMADLLGRPLWPDESVHHKNGDRQDNRPENLELWSRWQPPGQRVADKVAYAKELLARYEPNAHSPVAATS